MKPAPFQLHQLSFRRVSVELNEAGFNTDELDEADKNLTFDGVLVATHVNFAPIEQPESEGKSFLLILRVVIDNKAPDDGREPKPIPYLVDIEAGAVVRVAKGAEKLSEIDDIVLVNGTSLLWGAIREQVCNLTARMPLGLATLPTVHFQDIRKQRAENTAPQVKQRKPRASKSPAKRAS
jgi:hypothetical protein